MAAEQNRARPALNRTLGLRELVLYGIILVQPTAPMPLYGVVCQEAKGHVVTTVLIGMVAMLFTAVSYGRMARAYPSAGSAYTYVGRELHPALGYLTGWAMIFDYVINPVICVIWCSKAAMNFVPQLPYAAWAVGFAVLFTLLNVRGIRASARTNQWMAAVLGLVIVAFFAVVIHNLLRAPDLTAGRFWRPFYDPAAFSWGALSTGTSIAVLTYIGFDSISTLSEEACNPRRNIMLATVLTCLVTGVLAAAQVYAAQLVWPGYADFPDADTAFVHIAGKAGGPALFFVVNLALLLACVGSGAGSHLAAGRLLYGMGRDNAIPRGFFGALDPRTRIPRNNILLVGGLVLVGAFVVNYQLGAELLNFGAFIGFMGVNLSAFMRYFVRSERKTFLNLVPPLLGFLICFYIWLSLRTPAKCAGSAWLATGLLYGAYKTKWFTRTLEFAAPEEELAAKPDCTEPSTVNHQPSTINLEPAMKIKWPDPYPGAYWLDAREERAVLDVLHQRSLFRYYGLHKPSYTLALEKTARQFYGVKHALGLNSGTGALFTAMTALGIGPGSEVIVPAFFWVATVGAVVQANAIPVLCEIDDSFSLDPQDLERRITPRTRLIVAVHMAGAPCDMRAIMAVARRHRLPVLEDCAQANGGSFQGKKLGTFGTLGMFSFQWNKNATAGEGGLLVTNDRALYERCNAAHDLGLPWVNGAPRETGTVTWGAGRRMSELTGAVASVQLPKLPRITQHMGASKRRIKARLEGTPGLSFRRLNDASGDSGPFLIFLLESAQRAKAVVRQVQTAGLRSAVRLAEYGMHIYSNIPQLVNKVPLSAAGNPWHLPQNQESVYDYARGACPRSDDLFARAILLPVPSRLTLAQERQAASILQAALTG